MRLLKSLPASPPVERGLPFSGMGLELIPADLRKRFTFEERDHACAILKTDFKNEFRDILDCLRAFTLKKSYILEKGGGRSPVPYVIDGFLSGIREAKKKSAARIAGGRTAVEPIGPPQGRGWGEKKFNITIQADGIPIPIPTHKIDNFKNRVGIEVEWNNKTEFFDRDLNNFRLLRQLRVLSVGVIITRLSELQEVFDGLGKGAAYGNSTTHWDKLIPKVEGGGAGGCPLLLVGMGYACYDASS
jgi:hypothetical protein